MNYSLVATALLIASCLLVEFIYCGLLLPSPQDGPMRISRIDRSLGGVLYWLAHLLSVLRLPFIFIPYFVKLAVSTSLRRSYKILDQGYVMQSLHVFGDFVNLYVTGLIIQHYGGSSFYFIVMFAESVRLGCERGQMIASGAWQAIPHREYASRIGASSNKYAMILARRPLKRYVAFYRLTDVERLAYTEQALRSRAAGSPGTLDYLKYFSHFRLLTKNDALRGGAVRDVAGGEVYINPRWTSDVWLMMGLALRRAPWMFDPRILRRPFFYRTESARMASRVVLDHARYFPPFTVYQFGHEIKDSRYGQFYGLLHLLNIHIEEPVSIDGTYPQDHLLRWLEGKLGRAGQQPSIPPLPSDEQVIEQALREMGSGRHVTPLTLAVEYSYPLAYTEDVLMTRILARRTDYQGVGSDDG